MERENELVTPMQPQPVLQGQPAPQPQLLRPQMQTKPKRAKPKQKKSVYKKSLPWDLYEKRDLTNSAEAVTFVHEADIKEPDKEVCFIIYKELLNRLQGMPRTMEECGRLARYLEEDDEEEARESKPEEWRILILSNHEAK